MQKPNRQKPANRTSAGSKRHIFPRSQHATRQVVCYGKEAVREETVRPPDVVIDNSYFEGNSINDVNINDIAYIDIIPASGAQIFGSRGSNGAIVITLKEYKDRKSEPNESQNVKTIVPLGYQKPAEFYSPKYVTEKEKNNPNIDLRTTIYWKPDVLISKDGSASFSFYTADTSSKYHILIEGVSSEGQLFHEYSTIVVR